MKTRFFAILLCAAMLLPCLCGCGESSLSNDERGNDHGESQVSVIDADWSYYKSAEEIIDISTNVYTGKLTNVSFEIIDYKTGEVDRSKDSQSTDRAIYTIYTVETTNFYKGVESPEMKIRLIGGQKGFKEEEQRELLRSAGMIGENDNTIIVLGGSSAELKIGETYLFCTVKSLGDYELVINPTQFALEMNSDMAKNIIKRFK